MKAITLYQPWASSIAVGGKKIETRSWPCEDYRGPIAIHAGKKTDELNRFWEIPFADVLIHDAPRELNYYGPESLPLGCIVAVALLVDCVPTDGLEVDELEALLGDFSPGRWAWKLENIKRLDPPIPARGYQKLWDWDAPPEVEALLK
jgi:hypothetical protein